MDAMRGGIVAENRTVCRSNGQASRMASMSSAKPMSSISSASSSTTSSTASSGRVPRLMWSTARPGRGHDDVDAALEHLELVDDRLAAVDGQHLGVELAAVLVDGLGDLDGQLAGGHEHEGDGLGLGAGHDALEDRQREGRRLAGAGGGLAEQVAAGEDRRDRLGLDRRRLLVAEGGEGAEELGAQAEVGERGHVLDGTSSTEASSGVAEGIGRGNVGHWWLHRVSRSTCRARLRAGDVV